MMYADKRYRDMQTSSQPPSIDDGVTETWLAVLESAAFWPHVKDALGVIALMLETGPL